MTPDEVRAARAGYGAVARRGMHNVGGGETASSAWAREVERARARREGAAEAAPTRGPDRWVDEGLVDEARKAVGRGTGAAPAAGPTRRVSRPAGGDRPAPLPKSPRNRRRPDSLAPDVLEELTSEAGARLAPKLVADMVEARDAVDAGRDIDARRIMAKVVAEVPGSPAARELYGIALYRLGKYRAAAAELELFRQLTGETSQHPVLADCYRALKRYDDVEALWLELREASPGPELVAEGRIVMAGSLADRGQLRPAIALLEKAPRPSRKPAEFHLRTWYALADLYERAGDLPAARTLFRRIHDTNPRFVDVAERIAALG